LLDSFGITNNAANCLAYVIGFQSRGFPYWFVDFVVKLGCIPAIIALGYRQYLIASIGKPRQSAVNFLTKLWWNFKLTAYRYSLHLTGFLTHPSIARI
jgi:hypothetical protein